MEHKISGVVVRGDQYGRKLGFPTINIDTKDELPKAGVYSGTVILENKNYRAGILINPAGKVEAHLLDFAGDAYGKVVILTTKEFLRDFKKFDTEVELKAQIEKDLEKC